MVWYSYHERPGTLLYKRGTPVQRATQEDFEWSGTPPDLCRHWDCSANPGVHPGFESLQSSPPARNFTRVVKFLYKSVAVVLDHKE